jgi:hypothetical protein
VTDIQTSTNKSKFGRQCNLLEMVAISDVTGIQTSTNKSKLKLITNDFFNLQSPCLYFCLCDLSSVSLCFSNYLYLFVLKLLRAIPKQPPGFATCTKHIGLGLGPLLAARD